MTTFTVSDQERFWSRVDATGDCWEWTAGTNNRGYGVFYCHNKSFKSHRVAWMILVGPITTGHVIDHLCRNHRCVNPDHLEPVTQRTNVHRGAGVAARFARQMHCLRGHPYTGRRHKSGYRLCLECYKIYRDRAKERANV